MESTFFHAERQVLADLHREFNGKVFTVEELRSERDPRRRDGGWRVVGFVRVENGSLGQSPSRTFLWFSYLIDSASGQIQERRIHET
jgi:hypothetical protein